MKTHFKHHVIGGGTVFDVRPHLSLCAPAYGETAKDIARQLHLALEGTGDSVHLHLTRMAGGERNLDTNGDIERLIDQIIADPQAKMVFMTAALVDFSGAIMDGERPTRSGKGQPRLKTRKGPQVMALTPMPKVISRIRKERKDIFLVGCKTTTGETPDGQYLEGLQLLKEASCNLVLANDTHTRLNMVITPEQARYYETPDREKVVRGLTSMALARSTGKFTRSTIVPGDPVPWDSDLVPHSLRAVVNYCIGRGAYKPFLGSTVGHFAVRIGEGRFLTSRRKTNFNKLNEAGEGLVLIETDGDDRVIAHGSRPSVGGQSQRIVFTEHPDVDVIVHFHCPLKAGATGISVMPQWPHECGSHGCGKNTSDGLRRFGNLYAVMLDQHGPNVVFHHDTDPAEIIAFIEANFDLGGRTDNVQERHPAGTRPASFQENA